MIFIDAPNQICRKVLLFSEVRLGYNHIQELLLCIPAASMCSTSLNGVGT